MAESKPKITVLMPVYNGEKYLRQAIESVLGQTEADFEFLILDDSSGDQSVPIIREYKDPRIRLVINDSNMGIAATLNRGIQLSRGAYVARMDCDDISRPERLALQAAFLDDHPDVSLVAAMVDLVDDFGCKIGTWSADRETVGHEKICRRLARENCLAHPSIMARRDVLVRNPYSLKQKNTEDYDLWLRLAAGGFRLEKIDRPLLSYRVHDQSLTCRSNQTGLGLKNSRTKLLYLTGKLKKTFFWTWFDFLVIKELMHEFARLAADSFLRLSYRLYELITGHLGLILSHLYFSRNSSGLFFLFPFYHIGGAEQVHTDIVAACAGLKPWVIISGKSKNDRYRRDLKHNARVFDLNGAGEGRWGRFFWAGFWAGMIRSHEGSVVYGANCPMYYRVLNDVGDGPLCIDMLHAFGGGFEQISLCSVARLNRRVVVTQRTRDDLERQYRSNGLLGYHDRVRVISNSVPIPPRLKEKSANPPLQMLYVGRGSSEKRVHLIGKIASCCAKMNLPVQVTLVGDVRGAVSSEDANFCRFMGEIFEPDELDNVYQESHVLLLVSEREGFPLVVMEAMARGVIPICTDVGGMNEHISKGETGFLVQNHNDEDQIIDGFIRSIEVIISNTNKRNSMSAAVREYAERQFSQAEFKSNYEKILKRTI